MSLTIHATLMHCALQSYRQPQGRHSDIGEDTRVPVIIPLFNTVIDLIDIIHAVWIQAGDLDKIILCGKYMCRVVNDVFTKRHKLLYSCIAQRCFGRLARHQLRGARKTSPLSLVPFPQLRKHSKRQRNRRRKRWNSTHNPRRTKSHHRHASLPFFPTIMLFLVKLVKSQV
jgi:hypothetical protein